MPRSLAAPAWNRASATRGWETWTACPSQGESSALHWDVGTRVGEGTPYFLGCSCVEQAAPVLEDRKEKRRKEKAVGGSSKVIDSHCFYVFAFVFKLKYSWFGLPRWCSGKASACQRRRCKSCGFDSWVGKIPWSRKWKSHSSILAWKIPWAEEPGGLLQGDTKSQTWLSN